MSRRIIFVVIAIALAVVIWVCAGASGARSLGTAARHAPAASDSSDVAVAGDAAAPARIRLPWRAPVAPGHARIAGTVIDRADGSPVPGVEVGVRGPLGEATVEAGADGTFALDVTPGTYRLFARGDDVMTVGLADAPAIDAGPRVDLAGMPDESLMPLVVALGDTNVELPVVRGASIDGKVIDDAGNPIAHAVVRARAGALRPALGTDIAETDEHGAFSLRVPAGNYTLDAMHAAYAGTRAPVVLPVAAGDKLAATLTLAKGCVIRGKVVNADGTPANEGALELRNARGEFGPGGFVESDGTFRFARTAPGEVTIRAWPWKSMPSAPRTFACTDNTRVDNIVFTLPTGKPALDGTIVDASGAAMPFAYIDVEPLDGQGQGQEERADAAGRWHVYSAAPGRYELSATAPGAGIAEDVVVAPHADVRVRLRGTGRIEGTTTDLASGSFEVAFDACTLAANRMIPVAHESQLVTVHAGHFTIDDAPACALTLSLRWHGVSERKALAVGPDSPAHLDVDLGPPRDKSVHGLARAGDGGTSGEQVAKAEVGHAGVLTVH